MSERNRTQPEKKGMIPFELVKLRRENKSRSSYKSDVKALEMTPVSGSILSQKVFIWTSIFSGGQCFSGLSWNVHVKYT